MAGLSTDSSIISAPLADVEILLLKHLSTIGWKVTEYERNSTRLRIRSQRISPPEGLLDAASPRTATWVLSPQDSGVKVETEFRFTRGIRRGIDSVVSVLLAATAVAALVPTMAALGIACGVLLSLILACWTKVAKGYGDLRNQFYRVYPGFPIRLGALPGFVVGDRMWKALWKLVENEQRFPRRGGRVLCVHGAVSFHRARPCVRPVCRPGSTRAPLNRIVKIVTNRASRYRHRTTSLS